MRRSALAAVLLAGLLTGCASTGSSAADGATARSAASSDRITAEEIAAAVLPTAYDLVDRLRRPWFRRSGPMGGEVVVYQDERPLGGSDELRQIPAATVIELQYVAHDEAVRRWGAGITGGVIVVVPRR